MSHAFSDKDVQQLEHGEGQKLYGDGALVVLKGMLEAGISYFGGYPGAPTSNLIDAAADSYKAVLEPRGIYMESSANEMSAAAMCTTSCYTPIRGAVTWKVLGNGVATDVLDHVSQIGVEGGTLVVVGEDYGVSSTTVAQRTLPWAMKSGIVVIDPRADQQLLLKLTRMSFELSEASNTVVALLLRPQLSHANAEIKTGNNAQPRFNTKDKIKASVAEPHRYPLPPNTQRQEVERYTDRLPRAEKFVVANDLNERFGSKQAKIGIITHGTVFNTVMRVFAILGLADEQGNMDPAFDLLQLNVINPLCEDQIADFMADKDHVLLVEEGQPDLLEKQIRSLLHQRGITTPFTGHDLIPGVGELVPGKLIGPLSEFTATHLPEQAEQIKKLAAEKIERQQMAAKLFPKPVTPRPPTFCTGCPERPVFSQMKINEMLTGEKDWHATDVGCYGMAGLAPFNMADSNMGMGGGLAAATALSAMSEQHNVSVVGDGTLWHSAMNTCVVNGIYNKQDATYVVLDNKWTAMTGAHENPNSGALLTGEKGGGDLNIERTFKAMGVKQVVKADPYKFKDFQKKLKKIQAPKEPQLRVIISEGECQLQRQRTVKPERRKLLAAGARVEVERLGVDNDVCVGDHACMRVNGCPSLTLNDSDNLLKSAKVAAIDTTCVGCGVCGEIAHAARLCPSFHKVTVTHNVFWYEKLWGRIKSMLIPVDSTAVAG
ncbi:MAG: indolepyruvate ferredoxin oxidoreductase subunit alpha [Immundisolibacteraceae bacterium]|nr:indolepyruvate ferredoxin oxidoreductase subunit alpha [Immundisolibacteraceae bacterium]